MREDVPVGGVVYYGYSKEDTGDWSAGINELKKGMNSNSVQTSVDPDNFEFRYYWMLPANHVVSVTASNTTRGLPFTIYSTGFGNVWAWIGSAGDADMSSPNWSGRTSGDIWKTGSTGIATTAASVSFVKVPLTGTSSVGTKATAMYGIQDDDGALYVFPNNFTSQFTPAPSTLTGTPANTSAKLNVFGPIHASNLAGFTSKGIVAMPTQTTQLMPPGDYQCSTANGSVGLRAVMLGSSGAAMIVLGADTGTSTYDDE